MAIAKKPQSGPLLGGLSASVRALAPRSREVVTNKDDDVVVILVPTPLAPAPPPTTSTPPSF